MKDKFKHIAMLSTHGYFDPVPQLGQTDTGGQVVYVLELAKALARIGIKVDIYTRWFDAGKLQVDPVPGHPDVRIIRIAAGSWEFIPKEFIYDVLPELANNMIRFINENALEYDLFHGHYVDAGIVTLDVANYFKKPAYFTAHSLGEWKRAQMKGDPQEMEKKFNFKHRMAEEMRIFKAVNGQSLTSKVQLEKLHELYEYKADNIDIMAPGVDIHKYKLADESEVKIQTELPEKYIYCISRLDTNKGHDLLLEAFAIVQEKIDDVILVIGGGSPNPESREKTVLKKMQEIIEKFKMRERVIQIGFVPNDMMVPYYQQAQMFVLPSKFEPFGMTTQEAMACGSAVVASSLGGIRNVINDGENGLLVDPENTKEFAGAMIKLLTEIGLKERLGKKAHEIIVDEYSWEAMAEKHLIFFDKYM